MECFLGYIVKFKKKKKKQSGQKNQRREIEKNYKSTQFLQEGNIGRLNKKINEIDYLQELLL